MRISERKTEVATEKKNGTFNGLKKTGKRGRKTSKSEGVRSVRDFADKSIEKRKNGPTKNRSVRFF